MIGRVVSDKMKNTVTVLIESRKTHPLYKKSYAWTKKFLVDDQLGAKLGDIVEIVSVRPISKRKHFKVNKIIGKDVVALGEEAMQREVEEAIAEVMPEEEKVEVEGKSQKEKVKNASENSKVEEVKEEILKQVQDDEKKPKKVRVKKEEKK